MSIPNVSKTPHVWNAAELATHAQTALNAFVDRRLEESGERYRFHVLNRQVSIVKLFKTLRGVDPANPDPAIVRKILLNRDLYDSLRYVSAPPVSHDDLQVLATRSADKIAVSAIQNDDKLVQSILALICRLSDPFRFPWVSEHREATQDELRHAIRATAVLHASANVHTERRGFGRVMEGIFEKRLIAEGFKKQKPPKSNQVKSPSDYPPPGHFYGECKLYARKIDFVVTLPDQRIVAIEAKDSSSKLNSVKRILNDTGGKAAHYKSQAGKQIITVGLLSGVFGVTDLLAAQEEGLFIVWLHDLDAFIDWLRAQ